MEPLYRKAISTPVGWVQVGTTAQFVVSVSFVETPADAAAASPVADMAAAQLAEYFAGKRRRFDLPLSRNGTPFQRKVWQALLKIPYGRTVSYKDIAKAVGNPRAYRAVGGASNKNPVAVVVPCHRVVGSNGGLTGYGSGLWRKEWLLQHEGAG